MADFYHETNVTYGHTSTELSSSVITDERNCFNATELEAVPSRLGQLFLITLYSLTSLLALIGNVTVIVVEIIGKESAHNIRKYLINLAVSDITIGVLCVPFTYTDFMLGQWIFPHWLCPTAQFVQLLSVFVTSLTLTFIGIERYMATLHPFSALHHWLECHTHIMLVLTWVFGAAYAYIPFENTATRPFTLPTDNQTYYECSYDNGVSVLKRRLFMTSNIVLTFILPLIVLIFSYSAIMRKLIHDERRFRHSSHYVYGVKFKTSTPQPSANNNSSSSGTDEHPHHIHQNHSIVIRKPISDTTNDSIIKKVDNIEKNVDDNNQNNKQNDDNNNMIINLNDNNCDVVEDQLRTKTNNKASWTRKGKNSPETEIIKPSSIGDDKNHSLIENKLSPNNQLSTSNIDLRKSTPFNYRSKTIKMMFTVILLYGICWMPIKLYQFLMDYGLIAYCSERELYAMVCLYFICHWMAMANSFVNPIIYSFMSKSFRNDFSKITRTFRQTFSKNLNQLSIKTASTQV